MWPSLVLHWEFASRCESIAVLGFAGRAPGIAMVAPASKGIKDLASGDARVPSRWEWEGTIDATCGFMALARAGGLAACR